MNIAGKVHGTLTINGIPSCRVGSAEKLGLKAHVHNRLIDRQSFHGFYGLPGCTAGRPSYHLNTDNLVVCDFDLEFRGSKPFSISPQAVLPGKSTSGGRCNRPFFLVFFTGCHDRNVFFMTLSGKVVRQIRVFEKIQDKVCGKVFRQIFGGVIND